MKDQTLASVDDKLVKAGRFLEDISSNSGKLECLVCFSECQNVIKWLKDVTNGKWNRLFTIWFMWPQLFNKFVLFCQTSMTYRTLWMSLWQRQLEEKMTSHMTNSLIWELLEVGLEHLSTSFQKMRAMQIWPNDVNHCGKLYKTIPNCQASL